MFFFLPDSDNGVIKLVSDAINISLLQEERCVWMFQLLIVHLAITTKWFLIRSSCLYMIIKITTLKVIMRHFFYCSHSSRVDRSLPVGMALSLFAILLLLNAVQL